MKEDASFDKSSIENPHRLLQVSLNASYRQSNVIPWTFMYLYCCCAYQVLMYTVPFCALRFSNWVSPVLWIFSYPKPGISDNRHGSLACAYENSIPGLIDRTLSIIFLMNSLDMCRSPLWK